MNEEEIISANIKGSHKRIALFRLKEDLYEYKIRVYHSEDDSSYINFDGKEHAEYIEKHFLTLQEIDQWEVNGLSRYLVENDLASEKVLNEIVDRKPNIEPVVTEYSFNIAGKNVTFNVKPIHSFEDVKKRIQQLNVDDFSPNKPPVDESTLPKFDKALRKAGVDVPEAPQVRMQVEPTIMAHDKPIQFKFFDEAQDKAVCERLQEKGIDPAKLKIELINNERVRVICDDENTVKNLSDYLLDQNIRVYTTPKLKIPYFLINTNSLIKHANDILDQDIEEDDKPGVPL